MWFVMKSPGSHIAMKYLWNYKKEVRELRRAIVSSIRGDSYSDLLEELEKMDDGDGGVLAWESLQSISQ